MEKRTKVNMKLIRIIPKSDSLNPRPWNPGQVLLTQAEVSAATNGKWHVEDISVFKITSKVDYRIFDIMHESKEPK
jgi:hypothetical protein